MEVSDWKSKAKLLHDEGFTFLSDLCAVDYLAREPRFEVVYQLLNMVERTRLTVKVPVMAGDLPRVPTVVDIWPTANFHEREVYDMFGIVFDGHPDLCRILMPDEWEGHPLRKDYSMGKVPVEFKRLSPGF